MCWKLIAAILPPLMPAETTSARPFGMRFPRCGDVRIPGMLFANLSPTPSIPTGRVAWYVTGRFYATAEGSTQDLGYFLHVEGIAADLFTGPISEANAILTFR